MYRFDRLTPIFSTHTVLRGVKEDGSTALVDFSKDLIAGHPGGSVAELLTVYGLADTLAENFPHIRQVRILIDGEPVETIKGHIYLRQPGVGLHIQLIADSIHRVHVNGRRHGPAVPRIDCYEQPRDRRQRRACGRPEPADFSRHAPPSPRLPVQIYDYDRSNLAGTSTKGLNFGTWDKYGQRTPGSERERSHRTDHFVEIHRGPVNT